MNITITILEDKLTETKLKLAKANELNELLSSKLKAAERETKRLSSIIGQTKKELKHRNKKGDVAYIVVNKKWAY